MPRTRLLLWLLLCVCCAVVDAHPAAARPRARSQRPTAEVTLRDIPKRLSPELKALIEDTFSDEFGVQDEAVRKLGEMGPAAAPAVPFLVRTWAKNPELHDFLSQISLNQIGDTAAPAMIARTKNASVAAKPELIKGLGWCSTWRIREGVLPYLEDPNPTLRHAAVASLYNCNDPRVVGPLIRRLYDTDIAVRKRTVSHFYDHPTAAAFDPLSALVNDIDPAVRAAALDALSRLKDPRVVPIHSRALQKPGESDDVRWRAVINLGNSGDKRAVDSLVAVVNDDSYAANIRAEGARGLAKLRAVGAIEMLIEILKNRDEPTKVRAAAAHALTDFADRRAHEPLLEAAKTADDDALRFWGAMGAATISAGAVCDDRIVTALRNYSYRIDGYDWYYARKQLVLRMIVEKGKTESIRSAAIAADPFWPRGYDEAIGLR